MARPKTGKPPKKNLTLTVDEQTRELLNLVSQHRQMSISALVAKWVNNDVLVLQQADGLPLAVKGKKGLFVDYMLIPQYDVSEVEITLLTLEEAKTLHEDVAAVGCWWWLRSPGEGLGYYGQPAAAGVSTGGSVDEYGFGVNDEYAVRPAFKIANLKSSCPDKILVGKRTRCTVIAPGLALADRAICDHRYDAESDNWETSELKAFIESDKFKAKL